jgi:hypothetical protein
MRRRPQGHYRHVSEAGTRLELVIALVTTVMLVGFLTLCEIDQRLDDAQPTESWGNVPSFPFGDHH